MSKGKTSSFGKAVLQDTVTPSLDSRRFQDADFKQKTALSRARKFPLMLNIILRSTYGSGF